MVELTSHLRAAGKVAANSCRTRRINQGSGTAGPGAGNQGLTEAVQRQEVVLAGLGSEKFDLEPRLTDRAHYQESVAQQHDDERQATEQRQQCLEHELTELRQHLLAQQTRLGGL